MHTIQINGLIQILASSACLKKICPASFHENCQWLKFPLNGLRAQSRVSPVVGLLPWASLPAYLGMAFTPFLVKQFDSVVISSFVRTGCTTRRWGWLLFRIGYSITHHYPLKITPILDKLLEYKRNWIQHENRMPRNRLPRVMKHYSQLAEGIMAELGRDFWIPGTGTCQQMAQLLDRYMMMICTCVQPRRFTIR